MRSEVQDCVWDQVLFIEGLCASACVTRKNRFRIRTEIITVDLFMLKEEVVLRVFCKFD